MDMMLAFIGAHFGELARNDVSRRAEYIGSSDPTDDPLACMEDSDPHAN